MDVVKRSVIVYGLWTIAHYCAPMLYVRWCVPLTLMGFIMSPFVSTMPHCVALRWVILTSSDTIKTMFVLLGTWVVSHIMINTLVRQPERERERERERAE